MINRKMRKKGHDSADRLYEHVSGSGFRVVILTAVFVLAIQMPAQAYIGPGAGFAVLGSFLVMFTAMLSALVTLFTWPIRYIIRLIHRLRAHAKSRIKRFVVLGLDGMDPTLVDRFMAENKLPNLAKLAEKGCFKRLGTTIPSISPVAWSSFLTGTNPGKHNIYDFLTIDRRTYMPKLSSVNIKGAMRTIRLGRFEIPIGKPDISLLRKSKPFWNILGERGIFSNIIRVPITFPPEKFRGVMLSGMCVPDLRGTQGTFSFYSTRSEQDEEHIGGEQFHVEKVENTITSHLVGPENGLLRDKTAMECPFTIVVDDNKEAVLNINGDVHRLKKGIYSDWINVHFKAGLGIKVRGICKFLLVDSSPEFKMYVTPIHIDPEKPAMPISHPPVYATYLAKNQGNYATLGLAEDTWALNARILNDDEFLKQVLESDEEREKMFFDSLEKVKHGLCVCVFDGTDRTQHMFWRQIDERHPAYNSQGRQGQSNAIEDLYQRMDKLVGKTLEEIDDDQTVLMIISDHGFKSFRRGLDLNYWLEQNGYLVRKENSESGKKYLTEVDFSKTRAFAIGLAGIYLNIKGREAQGIVEPGEEADKLRTELAEKLSGLIDDEKGQVAVNCIYDATKVYHGPYKDNAPDLIVGYNEGYRVSWETAIGQLSDRVFHDNKKAWSGDHCVDPQIVPGVLFCNRVVDTEHPQLMDIGPTVLEMFGVAVPKYMDGKPLTISD